MRLSIDELLAVVYRHYPRGAGGDFKDTEEHRRLVEARRQAAASGDEHPWHVLLDRVRARFPDHDLLNDSAHLATGGWDAGYVAKLSLPPRGPTEKHHYLGFAVSFLAPVYVVYGSVHVAGAPVPEGAMQPEVVFAGDTAIVTGDLVAGAPGEIWEQEVRFSSFSPDEVPYVRAISDEIAATFPGHEAMPPEVGKVIVPGVAPALQSVDDVTLYQCLFTDNW